jgi:acyl-CoA hydrolase
MTRVLLGDCVTIVESDDYWHQQLHDLRVPSDFPIRRDIQIVSTRLRTNSFYILGTYPKIRIIYYDNQDWTNELRQYMDRSKQKLKKELAKKLHTDAKTTTLKSRQKLSSTRKNSRSKHNVKKVSVKKTHFSYRLL